MSVFIPSTQQSAIFESTGNIIIGAVAGSGKTTTLINLLPYLKGTVALMAFGKNIAAEIRAKVAKLDSSVTERVTVGTFHSFGYAAVRAVYKRTKVEGKKCQILAERIQIPAEHVAFAIATVGKAKNTGLGALSPFNDKLAWYSLVDHFDLADSLPDDGSVPLESALRSACLLLKASNAACDEFIDFDDQIYIPILQGLRVWQYDNVLPDEAQDTNATRLALAKAMLRAGGRMIAVGDDRQAIMGFSGADADSMANIKAQFNAKEYPLTVSYRCPKNVVLDAQQWVSHIESHESAADGIVSHITNKEFNDTFAMDLTYADAILCRNTMPLITMAYNLIGRGVGCQIEGKDIATGLVKLATRWRRVKTIKTLRDRLESWLETETTKALAKGNENRAATVNDQAECLFVIMAQLSDDDTVDSLKTRIVALFGDTPAGERPKVVTLSTIHKSKGREWSRVFIYGKETYQPSKYARQDWQILQEMNLMYVAATRAMAELHYVSVT
jgi:superfamily I DNA/RNA helicase